MSIFKDAFKTLNPVSWITDLVGTGVEAYSQYRGQERAFEQQKELMEKQYSNQIDFWNKRNSYNSPENQMKLFEEAGINPYVAISGSNNATASYGNVMQSVPTPPNLGSVATGAINRVLNSALQVANIKNIQADTEKKESDVSLNESNVSLNKAKQTATDVQARLNKAIAEGREISNKFLTDKESLSLKLLVAENNQRVADTTATYRKIEVMGTQMVLNRKQSYYIDDLRHNCRTRTKLTEAQINGVIASTCLTYANVNTVNIKNDILSQSKQALINMNFNNSWYSYNRAKYQSIATYVAGVTMDDIINSRHFQSLSAGEQADILRAKAEYDAVSLGIDAASYPIKNSLDIVGDFVDLGMEASGRKQPVSTKFSTNYIYNNTKE